MEILQEVKGGIIAPPPTPPTISTAECGFEMMQLCFQILVLLLTICVNFGQALKLYGTGMLLSIVVKTELINAKGLGYRKY